jgi:O-antigen/teichoic acid export membrane protein
MAPERMRLLRRNLVSTYVVYGASVLSALVLTPVIVHALGKDAYGLWVFIGSITVFVALLDLGVGPSVVRFGAHARGAQTPEEISALASVGIVVYAVIGAASVVAGVVLAVVVPYLISIPQDLVEPARAATLLVVAGVAARFPLGLFNNLLLGQQRYDIVNVGNLTGLAVYFVLVAAILPWHGGIVLLATITLVSTLVRLGLPLLWLRRELPFLQLRRAFVSRLRIRELMAFSWHNFLIHLASKVAYSSDVIVVGIVLGAKAAALYGVPSRVFALVLGLGTGATDLLYPAFAELEGADEPQRQQHLLLAGLRLGMALMLLLALPLVLIPDQLIYGWIGPGWGPSSAVLALLGVVVILHQPAQLLSQYLVARGYQRQLSLVLIIVVGANLGLSIVLALAAGIWGVALATVVTEAAATVVLIPRLVRASSGPSYRAVAVAALRPVVPSLFAAALVLVAFSRLLDPRTLLALALVGVLWVAAFVPAVWFFGLGAADRTAVSSRFGVQRFRRPLASASD